MIKIDGFSNVYKEKLNKNLEKKRKDINKKKEEEIRVVNMNEKAKSLCSKLIALNTNNSISSLYYAVIKEEVVIAQYYEEKLLEYFSFNIKDFINIHVSKRDKDKIINEILDSMLNFTVRYIDYEVELINLSNHQAVELLNIITKESIKHKMKSKL